MSLKKNAAFLSALTGLIMLSGCVTKNNDEKTTAKTVTTETTKVNNANGKFINLNVEQKEKPTFNGYLEYYDEEKNGLYKVYYFNIGKADGVAISTAESYRYTGIDIDVSYTISTETEKGVEKTIEEATQKTVSSSVMTGMSITKGEEDSSTKTSSFSLEASASLSTTIGASYTVGASVEGGIGLYKAKAETSATVSTEITASASVTDTASWGEEFSKTKSVSQANSLESTKTQEQSKSIANAYATYSNSAYCESKTTTYHLAGDIEPGWYRYALFSLCEVYLVITLDETNHKAYIDYTMYPVADSFYYGIQYSSNGKYDESLDDKILVDLEDVLDYLNYDPYFGYNKVTFNANGGKAQMICQYVETNNKLGEIKTPTKEGYVFDFWSTDKEGINKFDLDTEITSDITLYAVWKRKDCTVNYYGLNGALIQSYNVNYGEKISELNKTIDKTVFYGWYADSQFNEEFDFNQTITDDTNIYGKYVKILTATGSKSLTAGLYKVSISGTIIGKVNIDAQHYITQDSSAPLQHNRFELEENGSFRIYYDSTCYYEFDYLEGSSKPSISFVLQPNKQTGRLDSQYVAGTYKVNCTSSSLTGSITITINYRIKGGGPLQERTFTVSNGGTFTIPNEAASADVYYSYNYYGNSAGSISISSVS